MGVTMLLLLFTSLHYLGYAKPFIYINKNLFQTNYWLYSILICIFCSLGLVCYVSSLKQKLVAVAVSLSSINIFGITAATIFFNETFLAKHFISLLIATIGILFILIKEQANQQKIKFDIRSISLPILASMFWGVGYTLFKIPLQWMGALTLSLLIECTVLVVAFIIIVANKKLSLHKFSLAFITTPHFYISGLLLVGGSIFVNIALTKLSIANVNILGMFTFPVSIIAAFIFNNEKPTIREWLGMFFITASILFLLIVN